MPKAAEFRAIDPVCEAGKGGEGRGGEGRGGEGRGGEGRGGEGRGGEGREMEMEGGREGGREEIMQRMKGPKHGLEPVRVCSGMRYRLSGNEIQTAWDYDD